MNRNLANVILGGYKMKAPTAKGPKEALTHQVGARPGGVPNISPP